MDGSDLQRRIIESFGPTKEHPNGRRIVFWEDDTGRSIREVDDLSLDGIKVVKMDGFNGFRIKYMVEKEFPDSKFLIYMPFKRKHDRDEILADEINYSLPLFKADIGLYRAVDLGIPAINAHIISEYSSFFANKNRCKQFSDLEPNPDDGDEIVRAIMAAIIGCKSTDANYIIMYVLAKYADSLDGSDFTVLDELNKYSIQDRFWMLCSDCLGIISNTMGDLVRTLFISYLSAYVDISDQSKLRPYTVSKARHIVTFINQMFRNDFAVSAARLSKWTSDKLKIPELLSTYSVDELSKSDAFPCIDSIIISELIKSILETHCKLDDKQYSFIESRRGKHFFAMFENEYRALANAHGLLSLVDKFDRKIEYSIMPEDVVENYVNEWYSIDTSYRQFIYHLDQVTDKTSELESLSIFIEDTYNHHYLASLINAYLMNMNDKRSIPGPPQSSFFNKYVKDSSQATVVIISDAFRYECAASLYDKLCSWSRVRDVPQLNHMITSIPSITKFGMASLLPNDGLEIRFNNDKAQVFVFDIETNTLVSRGNVLKKVEPNSVTIHSDDLLHMNSKELKEKCAGKKVIYVYQNLIDSAGESVPNEDKVFKQCQEAIDEIYKIIDLVTNRLRYTRFLITADHGFIYRRRDLLETDKIHVSPDAEYDPRYIISPLPIAEEQSIEMKFEQIESSFCEFYVDVPASSKIYTSSGTQHYVHGGMSPQEMIVPVLEVFTNRIKADEEFVNLKPINKRTIRQYKSYLSFCQDHPVDDTYHMTEYELWFTDVEGNHVSDSQSIFADRVPGQDMEFRVQFNFNIDKGHIILNIRNKKDTDMPIIQEEYDISVTFTDLGGL
jgi:uncharacterized protein (TIGR02687 family)